MAIPDPISIKDGNGDDATVNAPLNPGRAAAAESRPVALSTEDKAALDAMNAKLPSLAWARATLLSAVTVTGAGSASADSGRPPSFEANVSGTGAVSATILIQGRNIASGLWVLLGTITLSGTASAGDGFASMTRYMEYRANCTAISGTGAALTVAMGS